MTNLHLLTLLSIFTFSSNMYSVKEECEKEKQQDLPARKIHACPSFSTNLVEKYIEYKRSLDNKKNGKVKKQG